ncbi:zinc finger domain-containing protein [Mycobacterium alsense]|uniref:zinc finger domain-containing protein n=1 Tax=Mycobacterium alsense TaxID=324058 RepID=UPI003CC80F98
MKRPIWAAYNDTDALSTKCTNCGALPGHWCTRPDGRVRRIPCVERSAAGIGSGDGKPYARDFSEPTHQPD